MRLPSVTRAVVVAVVAVLVLALVAFLGAIRYGAAALHVDGDGASIGQGDVQSAQASPSAWLTLDLENTSAVPVALRGVRLVGSNARILEARVVDLGRLRLGGLGLYAPPLPKRLQPIVDDSVPLDGAVVPPDARGHVALLILLGRETAGRPAVMAGLQVQYEALGLDQGITSGLVSCIRASGTWACPPYSR